MDYKKVLMPRHIFQMKLNVIRTKIIKRKYAYLLLHKYFGQILPSQAQNVYSKKLVKNCLEKWEIYWYESKIKRRYLLRANIHYRYRIYHKFFYKWKKYLQIRRIKKFNTLIAENFFINRLRMKYFILLTKNKELNKIIKDYRKLLRFRIELKSQHAKFLELKLQLLDELKQKWFYILLRPIYNQILMQHSLMAFINYREYAKRRRLLKVKLLIFIQIRYDPEFLRPFFQLWMKYIQLIKDNKNKNKLAKKFNANHLKRSYFQKLRLFRQKRQIRIQKFIKAYIFYKHKLKSQVIRLWKFFIVWKKRKMYLEQMADNHFQRKLFWIWKKNCDRQIFQKNIITYLIQKRDTKYLTISVISWRNYIIYQKSKKTLMAKAHYHYSRSLLKKYFIRLMKYQNYKIFKEIYQLEEINKKVAILNLKRLKFSFQKWKMYYNSKQKKKMHLSIAIKYNANKIKLHFFQKWIEWKIYKIEEKCKYKAANNFHNFLLVRIYFVKWKNCTDFEKEMRRDLEEAKKQYEIYLLKLGVKTILETGMYFQKLRHNINIRRSAYTFELTEKYFKAWKYKTWNLSKPVIGKQIQAEKQLQQSLPESIINFSNLSPRVPEYLKHKFT